MFKKIDVETFVVLIIIILISIFGYAYFNGALDINNFASNLGGGFLNFLGFAIIFYGIEFFQKGFNFRIRDEIVSEKNIAAAIYQGMLAIAIAILMSKGFI